MTISEAIKDIQENIKPIVGGKSLDIAIEILKKADIKENDSMSNYEVLQTMTVKELANWLKVWMADEWGDELDIEKWLRQDSQKNEGLLTDSMKKYWKVH